MDNPSLKPQIWSVIATGRCSECARAGQDLGRITPMDDLRCRDCCFGPPMEFWTRCGACGYWQAPHGDCDRCGGALR